MAQNWESKVAQNALDPQEIQDQVENARLSGARDEKGTDGKQRRLAAGEWLRAMTDFAAPFGHDGMPTVWG